MMRNTIGPGRRSASHQPLKRASHVAASARDRRVVELELRETRLQFQIEHLQKLQKEVEASSRRSELLYQNAPIGYITLTDKGLIQHWNASAALLLDAKQKGLADMPFLFFAVRDDVEVALHHLRRCKRTEHGRVVSEIHLKGANGKHIPVQIVSVPFRQEGRKLLHTALIDLTERKKNERALEEAKEFSDTIIETIHEPLVVLDASLTIVRMNNAFLKLFGISSRFSKGLLFESVLNLWWMGNELRKKLEHVARMHTPLNNFVFEVQPRDGERRILLFNARPLRAKSNSPPLLLVAIEDITARKEAERMLAETNRKLLDLNDGLEHRVADRTKELSDSNKQLESFCYSIAHDLRAPLRAMAGFGAALEDEFGAQMGERGKDYLERIIHAGETMDRLIRDLLDYGRFNTADMPSAPIDSNEILGRVLQNLQSDIQQAKARVHCKQKLPKIMGHPVALEAVFSNLISNALKFVPEKTSPEVTIWSEDQNDHVRVWIADNGIGIAPQYQEKIFQVFQRLHSNNTYPGTGIGLAIVAKAMQRIGGSVGVESAPGKGSRFWIDVPRAV